MNREKLINDLKSYFSIEELVCPHVYGRFGDKAWQFLSTDYLHVLLIIRRDILREAMSCNGGTFTQRGLRCNICELVKSRTSPYLSSHILGRAGDFSIGGGISAQEAREMIIAAADQLPYNVRLESGVTWLHIDTLPQAGITQRVYEFKA